MAERAVQLDHLSKGRFMLGLGPGALPSDAAMIGLDMPQTRDLLEDAVDVITRLMRNCARGRVIQYSRETVMNREAAAYWIARSSRATTVSFAA